MDPGLQLTEPSIDALQSTVDRMESLKRWRKPSLTNAESDRAEKVAHRGQVAEPEGRSSSAVHLNAPGEIPAAPPYGR